MLPERRHLRTLWRALATVVAAVAVLAPTTAANADPSAAQIDAQINAQAAKLEQVVEAYNKVNSDLAASQAESARLAAELQPLSAALSAAHATAGQIAALAYEGGPLVEVSAVLTAHDSRTLVDLLLRVSATQRVPARPDLDLGPDQGRTRCAGGQAAVDHGRPGHAAAGVGGPADADQHRHRKAADPTRKVRPAADRGQRADHPAALRRGKGGHGGQLRLRGDRQAVRLGGRRPDGYDCSGPDPGRLAGRRGVAAAQRRDAVERDRAHQPGHLQPG